ncbi:type II secretion system minor pseudopilin GspJ [Shewanella baltica]|uniref:type II secretion system minor pseudopilin GspJ n=1 Tax=Shewanella baltica TaxID=62322 RepID=UPI002167D656|nr:type II secretion system minor pseudopilin GspJ [Shewanella baltica]MCS6115768.1 type II secretion system minor pseudopilin GspJ [Shewanella baltica]MCS6125141.1 type II secretion system minor pseudopilin GspJ [Shewanella baltica]MCS6153748.1 type II secretion system minor pseudopilin GspJ [Shewanella baltica]MDR9767761.1 type II secretion system minor pseudopilin GspJ [Shewanella baltica]UVW62203.1 type II secretion system minor pseudopilin GspJ [Shewanella baltica]
MSLKLTSVQRGFTLLEMLIAIAIFAMIGLASNAVLSTVLTNDEVTRTFSTRLKALQQGFGAIERDLAQMVARTPRLLEGGRGSTVFQTGNDILDSESEALVFYRLGWLNPDGLLPRGSLQSVAYVVHEGRLERWYFPYPEPEFGAEPIKTVVIDKVLSVEYSFFMDDKWERKVEATKLPKAIAMEIEIEGLGKIQRKFLLPLGAAAPDKSKDEDNKDENPDDANKDKNGSGNGNGTGNGSGDPDSGDSGDGDPDAEGRE